MKPTVSVITICYNAAQIIEETIQSVLSQTYTDYEYVFIDGNSKDNTVQIIESYRDRFEALGVHYLVISEPDKGIYDAMNKGIRNAGGQWSLMLNAGDVFVDNEVLATVFQDKQYQADVVYGNMLLQEENQGITYFKKVPARSLEYFDEGMTFCHQCVFVRTDVLKQYPFDTSLRIVADYDQFMRMRLDNVPFQHIEVYIAKFDASGVSMARPEKTLDEYDVVRKKAGIQPKRKLFVRMLIKPKARMRNVVRKYLPNLFYSPSRGWQTTQPQHLNRNETPDAM